MTQGRQESEWSQTLAIIATIGNILAEKSDRVDVRPLMPAHLRDDSPPPAATGQQGWGALKQAFLGGTGEAEFTGRKTG